MVASRLRHECRFAGIRPPSLNMPGPSAMRHGCHRPASPQPRCRCPAGARRISDRGGLSGPALDRREPASRRDTPPASPRQWPTRLGGDSRSAVTGTTNGTTRRRQAAPLPAAGRTRCCGGTRRGWRATAIAAELCKAPRVAVIPGAERGSGVNCSPGVSSSVLAALTRPPGAARSEPATVPGPPRGSPTRTGRDTWPGTRAATASDRGC